MAPPVSQRPTTMAVESNSPVDEGRNGATAAANSNAVVGVPRDGGSPAVAADHDSQCSVEVIRNGPVVAQEQPTASDVSPRALTGLEGGIRDLGRPHLTRAEARALRRSAPLTHAKLQEHFKGLGAAGPRHD